VTGTPPYAGAGDVIEVLSRRGALAIVEALLGGALTERALASRLSAYAGSVVAQRVEDLRRLGVLEVIPENGELRLSARGRRLQGVLDGLEDWAADEPVRRRR
jgi:DNA-binding HxlR family transcriptional regulator